MSVFQLRTFSDLYNSIREELQIASTDTPSINRLKRDINTVYMEVVARKKWPWLSGSVDLTLPAYINAGTASVTQNSNVVTLTVAPGSSKTGYFFAIDGFSEIYTINSHIAGTTTVQLSTEFTGLTNTAATYKIWSNRIPLPVDCKETDQVWHDTYRRLLENVGRQEYRRISTQLSRNEGAPLYYYMGDYVDPNQTSVITSMPPVASRSSNLMRKSLVFSQSLPSVLVTKVSNGDPVRLRISGAGQASYNGDILISAITTTSLSNDTIVYTGLMEYTESSTAELSASVLQLNQEQDYERYRELFLYPCLSNTRHTIHVDYFKDILPLDSDNDEPVIPIEDRIVLRYGALHLAWSRVRNQPEAERNRGLYENKLAQMEGKWQDNVEPPRIIPSKNYLAAKRSIGRKASLNETQFGPLGAGGSQAGQNVTGTPLKAAIFGADGVLTASTTTSTSLANLDGVVSSIQGQLDNKQSSTLTSGHILVGNGSNKATDVQLTGDAIIDNTGVLTVAAVGGSLAANVHLAEQTINAATSANTAQTVVKRDSSGNFSASTVTANLTGNVAGNVTGSLTGNVTGNVSGSAATFTGSLVGDVTGTQGATVVSTVGGSSASNVHSAEQLANAATNTNTVSTIVKRDSSGNFSAGTISANLTGNVTGNVTGAIDAPSTLSVGTSTASTINIGHSGATINIQGTTVYENVSQLQVTDPLITINKGGASGSGANSGIEVEENGSITAYAETSADRNSWQLKAPNTTGIATITPGSAGLTINQSLATTDSPTFAGLKTTGAQDFSQISTPSTPSTGHNKIYAKSDGNFYSLDSNGVERKIGSGAGSGLKNYISNGDLEAGTTTGWSLFNTTLDANKVPNGSITAGASSITTFATTSTNPLAGTYSLNVAASTAFTAGQGFISDVFNIDIEDRAQVLANKFFYSVVSGASNLNFSGTSSNTWAVYWVDVSNGNKWVQGDGVFNLVGNSFAPPSTGTVQLDSTCTQARLAVICINNSAGAASMLFDDFSVGPQVTSVGPAMSDAQTYTPVITGVGTTTNTQGWWRQVGDMMEGWGIFTCGTVPSTTLLSISLPSGKSIDPQKIPTNSFFNAGKLTGVMGTVSPAWPTNATGGGGPYILITDTATDATKLYVGRGTSSQTITKMNGDNNFSSGDKGEFYFRIPIAGFSSNTVQSADVDNRIVRLNVTQNQPSSASFDGNSNIIFGSPSSINDSTGGYSTITGNYTCSVTGTYTVNANIVLNATSTGSFLDFQLLRNGSIVAIFPAATPASATNASPLLISTEVDCNANDTLSIRINTDRSSPFIANQAGKNRLSISRLSGPAVVQASEGVGATIYRNAVQSQTSGSLDKVLIDTVDNDSHNAFSSANNRWVAPRPGRYWVTGQITWQSNSTSVRAGYVYINGVSKMRSVVPPSSGGDTTISMSKLFKLNAGDYIELYASQSSGGALNIEGGIEWTFLSVVGVP